MSRKLSVISKEMEGLSHSEIKKVVNGALTRNIIKGDSIIKFEDILFELFIYNNHGFHDVERAIKYLNDNGVSQSAIKDTFGISLRQIRNILNNES